MAIMSYWYHHPSFTMAMISLRFGTRRPALRLSTSAHDSSSSSHLSFVVATKNKVFEDQLRGIVCYKDEKGEMICEGYDEGSRVRMRLSEKSYYPWSVGVHVTDFIQLTMLRVFEDAEALQLKSDHKSQL